jgi:hypothetical protein
MGSGGRRRESWCTREPHPAKEELPLHCGAAQNARHLTSFQSSHYDEVGGINVEEIRKAVKLQRTC